MPRHPHHRSVLDLAPIIPTSPPVIPAQAGTEPNEEPAAQRLLPELRGWLGLFAFLALFWAAWSVTP